MNQKKSKVIAPGKTKETLDKKKNRNKKITDRLTPGEHHMILSIP